MSEEPPAPAPRPRSRSRAASPARGGAPAEPKAAGLPDAVPEWRSEAAGAEPVPAEPSPLEVPLEEQITTLPPLEYPGNPDPETAQWAADKRRSRIRVEIVGGALLVMFGIAATIFSGKTAFILIVVFLLGCLAAYEFLVTSFE